jgi:hypothetical protein
LKWGNNKEELMGYYDRIYIDVAIVVILCIGLMFSPIATAADQTACSQDIGKFCKNNGGSKADILYCLKAHENELSAPCKEHITKTADMREMAKEYPPVCKDDISKLCKDIKPGKGAIANCLTEHVNALSASCKEHTIDAAERVEKAKKFHEACKGDSAKFCWDNRSRRLGVVKCLEENENKLSTSCKGLIEKEKKDKEGRKRE